MMVGRGGEKGDGVSQVATMGASPRSTKTPKNTLRVTCRGQQLLEF